MKIVIIGGVAGGATAAARMRRLDEKAEIVLLERGEHISFANCGLPYFIGGEIKEEAKLLLQTPKGFGERYQVDVRILHEVTAIDRKLKQLTVKNLKEESEFALSYDKLLLATGAAPRELQLAGIDRESVFTLRNVADAKRIKAFIENKQGLRALVIGGGSIGIEMTENLSKAGVEVTLTESSPQILPQLDPELAAVATRELERNQVKIHLGASVDQIDKHKIDMVILSAGTIPDTALAKAAGLDLSNSGAIVVDDTMRTSDPDIYAVGDAVQIEHFVLHSPMTGGLAGPANKQGRIAADNITGIKSHYKASQTSAVVRVFDLTVATTGINEKQAKANGLNYDKIYLLPNNHASYFPDFCQLIIKVLYDRDSQLLLGAQVLGKEGADKRCDVFATAQRAGMKAAELADIDLCYAPPYGSAKDPINMAGYVMENLITGKVKQFHWHDVDSLPRDGSVTLLDTRSPQEYAAGHIKGFVNLPLQELHSRYGELDINKPVYITCAVGMRGYLACRILMQHGFDCYNLAGGYKLLFEIGAYSSLEFTQ